MRILFLVLSLPRTGAEEAKVVRAAPSILITDDDLSFRETLQSMFQPQGFHTLLAGDGEEALDIIRSKEVHIVLLDMHMPKLTGLETIRRVKDIKALLPCILLSADADEALVRQALTARADSVLRKPVTRQRITSVVQQALERTYHWPDFQLPGSDRFRGNP
ncbi:MAG: response regulator [Planctomycetes bacterium]|nr:response regulator [Planctomycetota bacterium]